MIDPGLWLFAQSRPASRDGAGRQDGRFVEGKPSRQASPPRHPSKTPLRPGPGGSHTGTPDPDSKAIVTWYLGKRTRQNAREFLYRLRFCLNGNRPQVSTDEWKGYLDTVGAAFGGRVDYGVVRKYYLTVRPRRARYAPPKITRAVRRRKLGDPDPWKISTSLVERSNLTVRTMQRRFTRLALGFSKKWENLYAACALHLAYYNFVWQPRPLGGSSPALRLGVTDRLWTVDDLVGDC